MSSPLQNNITNLQNLLEQVNALPEGTVLPELTNPADASKALSGYDFINEDGERVTGTIPTKTASGLTASGATVTVPSGYYATKATKSVTTATQATPSVSIDSAGKITATATQTAGYVSAGTKTGTKQLTTQAAKTVTPSTSEQTAVASGVYTTGAVKVAAIPTVTRADTTISVSADDTNDKLTITASNNQGTGYVTGANKTATKTITLTASGSSVTASDGTNKVSKSVATATQATPSISINSSGLITASATQTAGYVSAGTKSGTKQLTTQAAKTIAPSTSSQTAVAKNVYTTGEVTVAAIPSKYVDNSTVDAVESDVMSGKKFGANGSVKTGTFSLDTELNIQDDLIAQIQTALQNKTAGGGSGSGGGSVETCTVTLNFRGTEAPRNVWISGTQFVDGSIIALSVIDYDGSNSSGVTSPYTLTDIIKNSALTISSHGNFSLGSMTCEGCELLYRATSTGTVSCKITGSNASITITNIY